ncbi:hypothetical protein [Vulgatibacter incomptus]|uniref:Uncharacterized protein n=1 Tax=Vulgatibacter incomptus TaxID=1391653 RepID=A0A0K1P993_9BACT|nr:hypothetical protein [Vulgatibacter incomptus]AKU90090.1 hypothetical protein AKJ08_0477 [Vulgatibacter incomptus]
MRVDLQGLDAIEPVRIEGAFVVGGERREFWCDISEHQGSPDWTVGCDQKRVWINDIASAAPEELEVEVVVAAADGGDLVFRGKVRPTYHVEQDFNGPGCGTCAHGTATAIVAPEGAR